MLGAVARVRTVREELQRHAAKTGTGISVRQFLLSQVDDELQLLEHMLQAGEGVEAITQARQAIEDGLVVIPEGDLTTQAMWHLATEGVMPRLERLALAGALIAMEIDQMQADQEAGHD